MNTHRVVIVGGGFGGVHAAQRLKRAPAKVTLIDKRNFHLFQPLLYQVATGALSPANIAAPLRRVFKRQANVDVVLGEVVDIDVKAKSVILANDPIAYDTLLIATGAENSYFGNDAWEQYAPGLKTVEDATNIRTRILLAFEAAEREQDPQKRQALLTFVIVGGGPTGLELAGAVAEISRYTLTNEFRHIDPSEAHVVLIEHFERVLPPFPPELSKKAQEFLAKLCVSVLTGTKVLDIGDGYVRYQQNVPDAPVEKLHAETVLWAAGVKASALGRVLKDQTGIELDRGGRVPVQPDLSLQGYPEIFVIGDLALVMQHEKPLPGVAPVAMQQGAYVARMIANRLQGNSPPPPFRYRDLGSMATIGRNLAVAFTGRWRFAGFLAWLMWLFVHLMKLVLFENRVLVFVQWMWSYITWNRTARLITGRIAFGDMKWSGPDKPLPPPE